MAVSTELDTLVLNIEVNDRKNGESAAHKISTLKRALTGFQSTIQSLDTKVFQNKFASMTTSVKPFVAELSKARNEILALDRLAKKFDAKNLKDIGKVGTQQANSGANNGGDIPSAQSGKANQLNNTKNTEGWTISKIKANFGGLTKEIKKSDNTADLFFERFDGNNRIVTKFTANVDESGNVIENSLEQVNQTSRDVAGDGLKSFFLSIKRIALYRAIRSALKWITASLKEGIGNIVAFDDNYRQTMSEVTSSITVIKNSLGAVVMPLLQLVTPIIQGIAKAIGTLANGISYLTAKLKGESTWLKVNTDYLKEYNKQANKLSYDEFSVLSGSNETDGMFTTEQVESGALSSILSDCNALSAVLAGIATTLVLIGGAKIIGFITSGTLLKCIKAIWTSTISFATTFAGLTVGISILVAGVVDLVSSWNNANFSAWEKAIVIVVALGSAIAAAAIAASVLKMGVIGAITAAAAIGGAVLFIGTEIAKVTKFADGGMFEGAGTLYKQAGESGTEIVATGSRGTGVANVIQIEEAFYKALYRYNAAKDKGNEGDLVIELDGKELARKNVRNTADALRQTYNLELKPR